MGIVEEKRRLDTGASKPNGRNLLPAKERAIRAANIAADNRGRDVVVLEMTQVVKWVDYMVIATASSRRQAAAIADEIEAAFRELGDEKIGVEGYHEGSWIVLDFGDIVVHIFNDAKRAYYQLEHLWADAAPVEWRGDPEGGSNRSGVNSSAVAMA